MKKIFMTFVLAAALVLSANASENRFDFGGLRAFGANKTAGSLLWSKEFWPTRVGNLNTYYGFQLFLLSEIMIPEVEILPKAAIGYEFNIGRHFSMELLLSGHAGLGIDHQRMRKGRYPQGHQKMEKGGYVYALAGTGLHLKMSYILSSRIKCYIALGVEFEYVEYDSYLGHPYRFGYPYGYYPLSIGTNFGL